MILLTTSLLVKVNVMLPLDTINNYGQITDKKFLQDSFAKLAKAHVSGVMMDVWWGISEPNPGNYNFDGYYEVISMAINAGLLVQPVMSFHKCGGNVGDDCNVPLPQWAHRIAKQKQLYYMDQWGNQQEDYISASADSEQVFPGLNGLRTPIQIYQDFMQAFKTKMYPFLSKIDDIQVGAGPCGESRYPAYPLNRWSFPNVGAFQAFDPLFLRKFQEKAKLAGKNYDSPPRDAGNYNSKPHETNFFKNGFKTEYGQFFLGFYEDMLVQHVKQVVRAAKKVFSQQISIKIAGIHWWYQSEHHAAELTAGYYNANGKNAYLHFMEEFGPTVTYDFTCLEMTNQQQAGNNAGCKPEDLIKQVWDAAKQTNTKVSGENALPTYDQRGYQQILKQIKNASGRFVAFTYLRLSPRLIQQSNFDQFAKFVDFARKI